MKINWDRIRELARTRALRAHGTMPNSAGARCIGGWILKESGITHEENGRFSAAGGIHYINTDAHNQNLFSKIADRVRFTFGEDFSLDLFITLVCINDDYAYERDHVALTRRRIVAYCDMCEASGRIFSYGEAGGSLPRPYVRA